MCVCVCLCKCLCMCVCVCERERERKREIASNSICLPFIIPRAAWVFFKKPCGLNFPFFIAKLRVGCIIMKMGVQISNTTVGEQGPLSCLLHGNEGQISWAVIWSQTSWASYDFSNPQEICKNKPRQAIVSNVLAVQVCGLELDHQILHSRNRHCGVLTPVIPELSPRGFLASRASLLGQLQVGGETLSQENKVNGIWRTTPKINP